MTDPKPKDGCSKCGRFVSDVRCRYNEHGITAVYATCKVHGEVEPKRFFDGMEWDYAWEDFFGGWG